MPPAGSETSNPAIELQQTQDLDQCDRLINPCIANYNGILYAGIVCSNVLTLFRNCTKLAQGGNERLNVSKVCN